jgi:hypothetical protein
VGFINALTKDEVEAILAHELAHIRRRDYLVNLLQSFMEIVFFFNPAVLWISELIKAERENCCDDIAIACTNSKYGYIQALLSCQEYQPSPGLGMAMAGQKSNLLDRVKRIVNNNNQSLNIMEKTLLTIGLVAAGICTVAFSSAKNEIKADPIHQTAAKKLTTPAVIAATQSTLSKTAVRAALSAGKNAVNVSAASQAQPAAGLNPYTQPKAAEAPADTVRGGTYLYKPSDFVDGTTMRVMASKDGKKQTAYLFKRDGILYQFFMKGTHATAVYVNGEQKPVSQYQSKIDELIEEYDDIAAAPVPPVPPVNAMEALQPPKPAKMVPPVLAMQPPKSAKMVPPVLAMQPPAPLKPMTAALAMTRPMPPMKPMPPMAMIAPMKPLPPVKMDTMFTIITQSLIKQGVIKDKNDYDLDINNKYLSVDGVKQPEELHKQVLDKLKIKPDDKVNWHFSKHE